MSHPTEDGPPPPPEVHPHSIESASESGESASESGESSLFSRIMDRAGGYLGRLSVYLGSIGALVFAYYKVIEPEAEAAPGLENWAVLALSAVPLVIALSVEVWQWRQRRRKKLLIEGQALAGYFQLGPRQAADHDKFRLPDDAHITVTEWVRAAPHPVLHLTGLSGVGKSSLIQAWLIPELERGGSHRVIVLRSFDDPLLSLRRELLRLWQNPPPTATRTDIPLTELLALATRYLEGKKQSLLLIFDQFEEYFILRPGAGQADDLRAFFHTILADPPPGLVILLSYRKDHEHALAPLQLPPVSFDPNRNLQVNGHALRPFTIAEATAFFEQSGLGLSGARVNLALAEAASYEETRAHIRPIVLNVLGRILATLNRNPEAVRRTRGLIRGQVREWALSTPLQEDIRPLLEKLVSASGTVSPADEATLAAAARQPLALVRSALGHLENFGLLRCLSPGQHASDQRVWQVSHDFLARLFALIVESLNKTLWRVLRPWLAPAALSLWAAGVFFIWPHYQEKWAREELNKVHMEVRDLGRRVWCQEMPSSFLQAIRRRDRMDPSYWKRLLAALKAYRCESLTLSSWEEETEFYRLETVSSLQYLELSKCLKLKSLPDISLFQNLKSLKIIDCVSLNQESVIKMFSESTGRNQLTQLMIVNSPWLLDLSLLAALDQLESLYLINCHELKGDKDWLDLAKLNNLRFLALESCEGLKDTAPLSDLQQIERIFINKCAGLNGAKAWQGLVKLESLRILGIEHCPGLLDTSALARLHRLEQLFLVGCTGLVGVRAMEGLAGLKNLEDLDLTGCTGLDAEAVREVRKMVPAECRIIGPDGVDVKP